MLFLIANFSWEDEFLFEEATATGSKPDSVKAFRCELIMGDVPIKIILGFFIMQSK